MLSTDKIIYLGTVKQCNAYLGVGGELGKRLEPCTAYIINISMTESVDGQQGFSLRLHGLRLNTIESDVLGIML